MKMKSLYKCEGNNVKRKRDKVQIDEINQKRKAYFVQFISILSAYILMIDGGAHSIWTSPSLPYLISKDSEIPLTNVQGSWLISLLSFSSIFGPIIYLMIINKLGRKNSIILLGILQLTSWILKIFSTNFIFLSISQAIFGLIFSASCCVMPTYVGEIAGKDIRGIYLSLIGISMNIGSFLMVTTGAFLPFKTMNYVMSLIPIVALICSVFLSESPYFYLMKGHNEEAIKLMMKLSAVEKPEMVIDDIERIKNTIAENEKSKQNIFRELFFDNSSRKGLLTLILTAGISSLSGYIAILSFAQVILSYSGSSLKPEYGTMILTGIQIFSGFPAMLLIDFWGRKKTYLLSGILSTLSLTITGFFYLFQYFLKFDVSSFTWAPLFGLVFFMFACNIGINPLPFVYAGELFSVHMKGIALLCGGISFSLGSFAANILLQSLNSTGCIYIAFWIFAFFCILGPLIVWFTMPETKGKHLEEVLMVMSAKKKKQENNIC